MSLWAPMQNRLFVMRQICVGFRSLLQPVEIVCGDYQKATTFIDGQTFVFIPISPYRPLNATSGFTLLIVKTGLMIMLK